MCIAPREWLTDHAMGVFVDSRCLFGYGALLSLVVRLLLLARWRWGPSLLGRLPSGRLLGRHWLHELRNIRDDGLHHPGQCLDLMGEVEEGLGSDNKCLGICYRGGESRVVKQPPVAI
ncbi:hypothetical protein GW17_00056367 [Ensete ventricosum]|nr:hypothetical protein GW17_00056367 [Ensete ventricosum]